MIWKHGCVLWGVSGLHTIIGLLSQPCSGREGHIPVSCMCPDWIAAPEQPSRTYMKLLVQCCLPGIFVNNLRISPEEKSHYGAAWKWIYLFWWNLRKKKEFLRVHQMLVSLWRLMVSMFPFFLPTPEVLSHDPIVQLFDIDNPCMVSQHKPSHVVSPNAPAFVLLCELGVWFILGHGRWYGYGWRWMMAGGQTFFVFGTGSWEHCVFTTIMSSVENRRALEIS